MYWPTKDGLYSPNKYNTALLGKDYTYRTRSFSSSKVDLYTPNKYDTGILKKT